MPHVHIQPTFDAWRTQARRLLAQNVSPADVSWSDERDEPAFRFDDALLDARGRDEPPPTPALHVPRGFVAQATLVAHHRDPQRWALLYRLLYRLARGERHLMQLDVDPDVARLSAMARSVRRDRHKMEAFVRFRRIQRGGVEWFIAWHRPDHYVLPLAAPFFRDRFAVMNFAILTPHESVTWDRATLRFGPGALRDQAPSHDELEQLWTTYYASIFNPARVKVRAMKKELPVRHWATLPEAAMIPDLLAGARRRVRTMTFQDGAADVAAAPQAPRIELPQVPQTDSIDALRAAAASCRACPWACHATQTVFGEGPANARVVFVGEQPGDNEDRAGRPFVGPAGALLDEVMRQVGLDRRSVYLTNVVKHFKFEPRGHRRIHQTPSARDAVTCLPWLTAELAVIKPRMVVALGATAARALFGHGFRVTASRGEIFQSRHAPWSMATYHPSLLLRMPDEAARGEAMRLFRADLASVATALAEATKRSPA